MWILYFSAIHATSICHIMLYWHMWGIFFFLFFNSFLKLLSSLRVILLVVMLCCIVLCFIVFFRISCSFWKTNNWRIWPHHWLSCSPRKSSSGQLSPHLTPLLMKENNNLWHILQLCYKKRLCAKVLLFCPFLMSKTRVFRGSRGYSGTLKYCARSSPCAAKGD